MGRDDWWHNTSWNEDIEAAFFNKIARARNKSFYLRCQAGFLASSHPETALQLLDQYFGLGADSSEAEAHFYRARARVALRDMGGAVAAFEAALAREDAVPNFRTSAFLALPVLIATERVSAYYDKAIQVLMKHKDRPVRPVERYRWHGTLALILHERGQTLDCENEARRALEAAKITYSGFRYHPDFGLVDDTADEFGNRLKQIANKPRSRLLWWRK